MTKSRVLYVFSLALLAPLVSYADCLHIGDSQSAGSGFQQTLQSALGANGYNTKSYARVGATTLDWSKSPAPDIAGRFPVKSYPGNKEELPKSGDEKSWLTQLMQVQSKEKPLECVVVQLGDNDFGFAKQYIEVAKKSPSKAKEIKDKYIAQVKALAKQINEFEPKIPNCSWIGPTFKDRAGSYPNVTNEMKQLINQFQAEAIKETGCSHVNGMDSGLEEQLKKTGSYTSDGLHLNQAAGAKWAQYAANAVVEQISGDRKIENAKPLSGDAIYTAPKKLAIKEAEHATVKQFNKQSVKEIDIRDYVLPLNNSIKAMSTKTGRTITLNANKNMSIQVIGKAPWGYKIRVYSNNILLPGEFVTATSNVKNGVNWFMLNQFNEVEKQTVEAGSLEAQCLAHEIQSREFGASDLSTLAESADQPSQISPGEWKPGCEVLGKSKNTADDKVKLKQCISSIQSAIIQGNRDANGQLNRKKVFDAMFSRLKPEEQRFAAKIFTAQGEVGWPASNGRYHEMMAVMKVLENRVEMAKQRRWHQPFNELDIAVFPSQFSMYNPNERNWKRVIDPVNRTNFDNAIESFIRMGDASFRPPELANKISHYHTNYVSPAWKNSPRVDLEVDGHPVTGAKGTRHLFYMNVDGAVGWSASQSRGWKRP